jgi:hypothetical protein
VTTPLLVRPLVVMRCGLLLLFLPLSSGFVCSRHGVNLPLDAPPSVDHLQKVCNTRWASSSSRLDVGLSLATTASDTAEAIETDLIRRLVTNLFSVSVHIQNPDLYIPHWADCATFKEEVVMAK